MAKLHRPFLFLCLIISEYTMIKQGQCETTEPPTTPAPITCLTCQGLRCWTQPHTTKTCDATDTLCMSHVIDHADGSREIIKGCANLADCEAKYVQTTKNNALCTQVDNKVTGRVLDCFFCCNLDNCNQGPQLIPSSLLP